MTKPLHGSQPQTTETEPIRLKGFIQSGIIYVGDPVYMAGDARFVEEDPTNPFKNWDNFTNSIGTEDANLTLPGAYNDNPGRGCVIQTGLLNGKYEVVKEFDETGKLAQIVIKVLP